MPQPLPNFTATGNLRDILATPSGGEIPTPAWSEAYVILAHNIKDGVLVWDGKIHNRPPSVKATVDPTTGDIEIADGPVELLANDAGLNVTGIQWRCDIKTSSSNTIASFWFDAPVDGGTVNLATVAHIPPLAVHPVSAMSINDLLALVNDAGSSFRAALNALYGSVANDEYHEYANFAALPATGSTDLLYLTIDNGWLYRWTGSAYQRLADKASVGLGNADNTRDVDKPVSTAQQAALDGLESASGAMRNLMLKLDRGETDATWLVVGDSTGNGTDEWVYLTTQWLAAKFPWYTVIYHLWDAPGLTPGADADYQTGVTVQTGTPNTRHPDGPFTLHVWNASVAGSSTGYFQGTRFDVAIRDKDADLITISHMHNQNGPIDTDNLRQIQRNKYLAFVDEVRFANQKAGVVCILQNPKTNFSSGAPTHPFAWMLQRAVLVAQAAMWRGWGVIDVMSAFLDYGPTWGTDLLVSDGVHPNSAGQALWASLVQAAFDRAMKVSGVTQPAAGAPTRQLITNPELVSWSGTSPDGVTMSTSPACTASKELTDYETGSWAMLLTASSTSGQPYAQWGGTAAQWGIKGLLASKTYTVAVRVKVPASNTATVRVTLSDNNGSAQSCTGDVDATTRDRYSWVYVTKTFASNATSLNVQVSPRSSGTAVVTCLVDRIFLIPGEVPSAHGGTSPVIQNGPSSVTFGTGEVQTGAEANLNRANIDGSAYCSNTSGFAVFSYFTAKQNITINNLTAISGSTAAAATPTTVKMAVYSVDPSTGDLTRLAVTTNDTAVFAATFTAYTRALSAPVALTQGLGYAYAVLQVSGAAVATLQGKGGAGLAAEHFRAPRLSASLSAQTDLLASYTGASVGAKSGVPYIVGTT